MQPRFQTRLLMLLAVALLAAPAGAQAQVKNMGTPHIINYPKKAYKAASQSWSVTQDRRGFIYFGNNDGVLEFDGRRWSLYSLPDRYLYRALCIAADGTLYVGLSNDFGYLAPDANGKYSYHSISGKFPKTAVGFNDIWRIHETSDGIYFQAKTKIFLYRSDSLEVVLPEKEFSFLHKVNNKLYTSEKQAGLVQVSGTSVIPLPGGDQLAGINIESVLPWDETRLLIGTSKNGLFLYDGKGIVPWGAGIKNFLEENSLFCATQIDKKHFALGTIKNGVLIIDRNGQPVQHINQAKGLQNNTVLSMFTDREHNLWLGLDQGISYIEINSPITYYSYGESLPGTGYCSVMANGYLYAGTNQGLFARKWSGYENPLSADDKFYPVEGTQGQVWSLRFIGNTLFCGHNLGTFVINGTQAELISDIPGGWDYVSVPGQPERILGGTYTGMQLYRKDNGRWRPDYPLGGFSESSRCFSIADDGSVWIAHGGLGIFRVNTDKALVSAEQVRMYNESDGLPSRYRNSLFRIGNQILFTTIRGVYRYQKDTDSFVEDPEFSRLIGNEPVSSLFEDRDGNIWFFQTNEMGVIRPATGGSKTVEKRPFNPIRKLTNRGYESIGVIDDTNILIACEQGFAHYDPSFPARLPESQECHIRSVTGTGDSTLIYFGGIFTDSRGEILPGQPEDEPIRIPYAFNNLRFEFAVPLFDNPEELQFSYILEGYDRTRSDWNPSDAKEYTGLREGTYIFRVRGKSVYDIETQEARIMVRILPPWYRTLLAKVLYILAAVLLAALVVLRTRARILHDKQQVSMKHERDINLARQLNIAESLESEKKMALLEKEKLEAEVSHKNKQLANSVSELLKKNEFLIQLREEMLKIAEKPAPSAPDERLKKILSSLDENLESDKDYDQFEDHFDAVHDNFLKNLKKQFPYLTPKDLRLCAYLRMNLSTKEIAPLLNISPRGVEISRYRLRKKMNLPHDANLIDFMLRF